MLIKTAELIGSALDWAVAKCEIGKSVGCFLDGIVPHPDYNKFYPSTDWSQGGPIIERERITLKPEWDGESEFWTAISITRFEHYRAVQSAPTPLIAAMRCYVASKLGDEIKVPNELI